MTREKEQRIKMGNNSIFGYDTLVVADNKIIGIEGPEVPALKIGMIISILENADPYIITNFLSTERIVTIQGFKQPFKDGETDNIIIVSNGLEKAFIKPSNVSII